MELLMHLIEKNRIDIYDIPMAELTEQYLAYLDGMRALDIEVASDFLVMAAKLLLIKSRLILPQDKKDAAEEEEEDPREELVRRIIEYKRFKQVGCMLENLSRLQLNICSREPMKLAVSHLPPENLQPAQLVGALLSLLKVQTRPELPAAIVEAEHFSMQLQMEFILEALAAIKGLLLFEDLLKTDSREERAVDFLAVLELVHCRMITVNQITAFGDISLSLLKADVVDGGI